MSWSSIIGVLDKILVHLTPKERRRRLKEKRRALVKQRDAIEKKAISIKKLEVRAKYMHNYRIIVADIKYIDELLKTY